MPTFEVPSTFMICVAVMLQLGSFRKYVLLRFYLIPLPSNVGLKPPEVTSQKLTPQFLP